MDYNIIILLSGIIITILFSFFQIIGQYEYEPFSYKIGITIRKKIFKIKILSLNKFTNKLFKKNGYDYMFIENNICLIRISGEFDFKRPNVLIPYPVYIIFLKENNCIIKIKIPIVYLIIIGTILYIIIKRIFIDKNINIFVNTDWILFITVLLLVFLIIYANKRFKEVIINFIKIINDNK
jgi:hypothetical protein